MRQRKDPTRKAAKNLGNVKIEAIASDGAKNASDHFVASFLVFGASKRRSFERSSARVSLHTILFHRHDSLNMDN